MTSCRVLVPPNGRRPVSISMYTMARLYWSLCRLTHPSNVSGGAYIGVIPPVSAARVPCRSLASPKSATLTC
jgi:hypothetical protein